MTTETNDWPADYSALGIERETYACVSTGDKRAAMKYVFDLLLSGQPVVLARDASNPKLYHVAVPGGLAGSPLAWITNVRGEAFDPQECSCGSISGQHPIQIIEEETE